MKLTGKTIVQSIFDEFNKQFPFLRLEFYTNAHADTMGSKSNDQVSHHILLEKLNPALTEAEFIIDPEMTVSDFEKMMKEKYQLYVQVFRKSSDIWLQTSATDHWTLQKQNGKGERSLIDYNIDPIDITDFDVE
jgi:hypothetical protein